MNIGIDLDDTIANTAESFLKYGKKFNEERNIEHKIMQKEWDFDKAFGWNEENIEDFLKTYLEDLFVGLKPKEDAARIINKLRDEGNKIIIITARSVDHIENVYEICKDWLEKYNINVDKIETDGKDKALKCKENNIDIFIDDGVYHCEKVHHELNIPVLLMDSWYNEGYENKELKIVYNWEEIYEEINKIKNKEQHKKI